MQAEARPPNPEREARASVEELGRRARSIPQEIARALAAPPPLLSAELAAGPWVVSGIGASEGPARLLAALLRDVGARAEFSPASSFLEPGGASGRVLAVVSQRLSPNARLPLGRRADFDACFLLTTLAPERDAVAASLAASGVRVISHGPVREDRLFLRVVGPAVAYVVAMRLALAAAHALGVTPAWEAGLASLPEVLGGAAPRARAALAEHDPRALFETAGLVTSGPWTTASEGLRLKLVEGLGLGSVGLWDVCGVAHGPLQTFYERKATLLALVRAGETGTREVWDRLERVLDPSRHTVLRLVAELPPPLSIVEHDALLDHVLLAAVEAFPHNLCTWPAQGADAPIYNLGSDLL